VNTTKRPGVGIWLFPNATPVKIVEAIEFAESARIDEVWLGDEGPSGWDPFAICAAAAMRTSRIILGVAVANPITRHPGATTLSAMTISELSYGRFRLAYGPGGSLPLDPFGLQVTAPVATLEWALRLSRSVACGEPLSDTRAGFRYVPLPDARAVPELPIWVGARGPKLNEVAARLADGVFLSGLDRFQLPVVAEWARSAETSRLPDAPIKIAAYLTACFDERLVLRHAPQFVHGLANGPIATLAALGLDRAAVSLASDDLRRGNEEAAKRLMRGPVLDAVLAAGTTAHIASLLAEAAVATHASSVGLAVVGEHPIDDVSRCVDVFQSMDLISALP
jgi:5,10-methylenetetrahydromethanopterin reductase